MSDSPELRSAMQSIVNADPVLLAEAEIIAAQLGSSPGCLVEAKELVVRSSTVLVARANAIASALVRTKRHTTLRPSAAVPATPIKAEVVEPSDDEVHDVFNPKMKRRVCSLQNIN